MTVVPFWGALMIFGTVVIPLYLFTKELEVHAKDGEA